MDGPDSCPTLPPVGMVQDMHITHDDDEDDDDDTKACISITIAITIPQRHDYDEKLTCSLFARVEWKQARAIRRSRIVVVS